MKKRLYKKWLKNPFNKRLIWKFCKPFPFNIPIAILNKKGERISTRYYVGLDYGLDYSEK